MCLHVLSHNSIIKCFHILKKLRNIFDTNIMKMIYLAIAQSILTYCLIVWESAYKNALESQKCSREQ